MFNLEPSQSSCPCAPRSRSANSAANEDGGYDVIIIGAGCIGGAIARELSRYQVSVLLLEAADDVTQGATKGNSGIVHAGYDDTPGSVRARFCWPGNQMFAQLDKELRFGYQMNGSLVLATSEEEKATLRELMERGLKNGILDLQILTREEILEKEPYVGDNVEAALFCPHAGNCVPYEYAIALIENAVTNGVELRIRRQVTDIKKLDTVGEHGDEHDEHEEDGHDDEHHIKKIDTGFEVTVRHWEPESFVKALSSAGAATSSSSSLEPSFFSLLLAGFSLALFTLLYGGLGWTRLSAGVLAAVVLAVGHLASSSVAGKKNPEKAALDSPVGTGGRKVTVEEMKEGGSGSSSVLQGQTVAEEKFRGKIIINAAGGNADAIAGMIGDDSFKIHARLGDYILLNRNQGDKAHCTLFPCPSKLGKGVLVQQTLWGNLILGPTARDVESDEKMAQMSDSEIQTFILSQCKKLVPSFDAKEVIHGFCGARAKSNRQDWIIEPSAKSERFINVAGIDSPGLAGSPAIAKHVVELISAELGELQKKNDFKSNRGAIVVPKEGFKGLKLSKFEDRRKNESDPRSNVICKCEKVTEFEVVEAMHRNLPIDSTQAIRKRCRAGMGSCQAKSENYNCEARVAEIIARELALPEEAIGRRPWPATSSLPERWLDKAQKEEFANLKK